MNRATEFFPLVDVNGNVIGKASRTECHSGTKLLHPVVHLHYFNTKGELYLQKRAAHKDIQPNKWDTAVGGHVDYGENISAALLRESREELGLYDIQPTFLFRYIYESEIERELVHVYYACSNIVPQPDLDEVSEGHFWCTNEIISSLGKGIFTPNFEGEIKQVFETLTLLKFHIINY